MENSNGTTDLVTLKHALHVLASELMARSSFAQLAGVTFDGERDLYQICGYKRELTYQNYRARYERGGIAARIIDAFPGATWRNPPTITEVDKDDESVKSSFEKACAALVKRLRLWNEFERVDRLASFGHFAVLLIGLRGQTDLSQPATTVSRPEDIIYLASYSEEHTRFARLDSRQDSAGFGKPLLYEIDFHRGGLQRDSLWLTPTIDTDIGLRGKTLVHASRIIHVAENGIEDNIIGTPRLRRSWNYMDELDKVIGGSGEMFWRDAKGRFHLALRDGAFLSPEDQTALDNKVEEMIHGLRDMIQTSGIDLNKLTGTVADPSNHIDKLVELIAGSQSIPKRLLVGSERGELASSQDENNWGDITMARQKNHGEPIIARPFFDRAIQIGALPVPRSGVDGYNFDWPDPKPLTEQEKSVIALNWTKSIQTYASFNDGSIQEVLPLEVFLDDILGFDEEQIERIMKRVEEAKTEREAEAAEERAIQERVLRERQQGQLPREEVAA